MSAALVLLMGPLIWGVGFVATKTSLAGSGPLWANSVRFLLATLVLAPFALGRVPRLGRRGAVAGLLLGAFLFLAFSFQTAGMVTTDISHSSFITGLYAVFVPLFGPFFGRRPRLPALAAAGLALGGLALLTGLGASTAQPSVGDWLILGCAVTSAIHILIADAVAKAADSIALNWVQLATVSVLSLVVAPVFEGAAHFAWTPRVIGAQLYLAVFSSGVAFTLQFWAQRRISPATAAMIFLLEAPFGAVAGALVYGERLAPSPLVGGRLMLAASSRAGPPGEKAPPPRARGDVAPGDGAVARRRVRAMLTPRRPSMTFRFLSLTLALLALSLAPTARADDDDDHDHDPDKAALKSEFKELGREIGKTAKQAGKVAVHATKRAVQKTDEKLNGK